MNIGKEYVVLTVFILSILTFLSACATSVNSESSECEGWKPVIITHSDSVTERFEKLEYNTMMQSKCRGDRF